MTHYSWPRDTISPGHTRGTRGQKHQPRDAAGTKGMTYSPFCSVKGYDRTRVRRLSLREYLKELTTEQEQARYPSQQAQHECQEAPERGVRGDENNSPNTTVAPAKGERDALTSLCRGDDTTSSLTHSKKSLLCGSRFPCRTTFSSKYPVFDRLGCELCVLYQMYEVDVGNELHRVQCSRKGRQSGVRCSTEVVTGEEDSAPVSEDIHTAKIITKQAVELSRNGKEEEESGASEEDARNSHKNRSGICGKKRLKTESEEDAAQSSVAQKEAKERRCGGQRNPDGHDGMEGTCDPPFGNHAFLCYRPAHSRGSSMTVSPPLATVSRAYSPYRLPSVFSVFGESQPGSEWSCGRRTSLRGFPQHGPTSGAVEESVLLRAKRGVKAGIALERKEESTFSPLVSPPPASPLREEQRPQAPPPPPSQSPPTGEETLFASSGIQKREVVEKVVISRVPTAKGRQHAEFSTFARLSPCLVSRPCSVSRQRYHYPSLIDIPNAWRRSWAKGSPYQNEGSPVAPKHQPSLEAGIPFSSVVGDIEKNFHAAWRECCAKDLKSGTAITSSTTGSTPPCRSRCASLSAFPPVTSSMWMSTNGSSEAPSQIRACLAARALTPSAEVFTKGLVQPFCQAADKNERPTAFSNVSPSPLSFPLSAGCLYLAPPTVSSSSFIKTSQALPLSEGSILLLDGGTRQYRIFASLSHDCRVAHGLAVGDVWKAVSLSYPCSSPTPKTLSLHALPGQEDDGFAMPITEGEETNPPDCASSDHEEKQEGVVLLYPWRWPSLHPCHKSSSTWVETVRCAIGYHWCLKGMGGRVQGFRVDVKSPTSSLVSSTPLSSPQGDVKVGGKAGDEESKEGKDEEKNNSMDRTTSCCMENLGIRNGLVSGPATGEGGDVVRTSSCVSSLPVPTRNILGGGSEERDEVREGGTMICLPPHYQALPLSLLSLTGDAYRQAFRLVLQTVCNLLSKRLVHGSLQGLDNLWIAVPLPKELSRNPVPKSRHHSSSVDSSEESINASPQLPHDIKSASNRGFSLPGAPCSIHLLSPPILLPLHWERCVDFRMFSDRRVGRDIPLVWDLEQDWEEGGSKGREGKKMGGERSGNGEEGEDDENHLEVWQPEGVYVSTNSPSCKVLPRGASSVPLHQGSDLLAILNEMLAMQGSRELKSEGYYEARELVSCAGDPSVPLAQLVLQTHRLLHHPSLVSDSSASSTNTEAASLSRETAALPCSKRDAHDAFHYPVNAPGVDEWRAVKEAFYEAWWRWNGAKEEEKEER